jgi:hypothetical protein
MFCSAISNSPANRRARGRNKHKLTHRKTEPLGVADKLVSSGEHC